MRISDWSSDVCSSDLRLPPKAARNRAYPRPAGKNARFMITAIRAMFSSTIGKFLALAFVALVGVAFALSDVTGNSAFGGVGGANVAKVGSENIGVGDLRERVRQTYDQARQDRTSGGEGKRGDVRVELGG